MRDLAVVRGAIIGVVVIVALWAVVGVVIMAVLHLLDAVGL